MAGKKKSRKRSRKTNFKKIDERKLSARDISKILNGAGKSYRVQRGGKMSGGTGAALGLALASILPHAFGLAKTAIEKK